MAADLKLFTPPTCVLTRAGECTVISLRGEHDAATAPSVSVVFAQALASRVPDVIVDLSEVRFMGAATVRIILEAREVLLMRGAVFSLRSPSVAALRTLQACGLGDLLQPDFAGRSSVA